MLASRCSSADISENVNVAPNVTCLVKRCIDERFPQLPYPRPCLMKPHCGNVRSHRAKGYAGRQYDFLYLSVQVLYTR